MKQVDYKKISILGLILLATSSVIAAFYSDKDKKSNVKFLNGMLVAFPDTFDTHTCVPDFSFPDCHDTASWEFAASSSDGFFSTTIDAGNTTTGDFI